VPATEFETSGAVIGPKEIEELMKMEEIYYLGEVMNFPGVIHGDPNVLEKLRIANTYNKPIDGHAPGLRRYELQKYIRAVCSRSAFRFIFIKTTSFFTL